MATLRSIPPTEAADNPKAADSQPQKRGPRSWLEGLALDTRDVSPLPDAALFWRAIAQAATVLMAILAFGVFLFFAGKLVVPVLAAIAVGMTFGPVIRFTNSRGVPDWVMALVVLLLLIGALNTAIIMLAAPVTELMGRAPELGTAIKEKLLVLDRPLAALY